jgi:hypothetical protein
MKVFKFLQSVLFNTCIGMALAFIVGFHPAIGILLVNIAGVVMYQVNHYTGVCLFDGLAAEVWLPDVMQNFYPDNSFLSAVRDLSSLVLADAINLAEAGADPDVLVDNTVFPIPTAVAADTPLRMVLKTYDTTSTVVRNAIAVELKYDQRALYVDKHRKALLKQMGKDAAYAYAPQVNSAFNPVLNIAGTATSFLDTMIDLQNKYNNLDDDGTERVLVLNPDHAAAIAKEDRLLYKSFEAEPGKVLFGFKIYTYTQLPFYVTATATKAAYGAAFDPAVHAKASIAFLGSEVMKSLGTFEMFSRLKDPDNKGDVFNFQARFLASTMRNKYLGAIIK